MAIRSTNPKTVEGFGAEGSRFDQGAVSEVPVVARNA
jgi:hypothetical protein